MDPNEPRSSGVQFVDEDAGWKAVQYYREPSNPKVIQLVINYSGGLIKDPKKASYVVLLLVVLMVMASIYFAFFLGTGDPSAPLPHGAKVIYPTNGPPRLETPIPKK